jgi:hypothetical protein
LDGCSDKDSSEEFFKDSPPFFDTNAMHMANKLGECGVVGVSGDEF